MFFFIQGKMVHWFLRTMLAKNDQETSIAPCFGASRKLDQSSLCVNGVALATRIHLSWSYKIL